MDQVSHFFYCHGETTTIAIAAHATAAATAPAAVGIGKYTTYLTTYLYTKTLQEASFLPIPFWNFLILILIEFLFMMRGECPSNSMAFDLFSNRILNHPALKI